MPTTPDPLAGDVPNEPTPRTGWRRFTPWLAALLAVVVVVGWQVLSRNPSLDDGGVNWSSAAMVTCGADDVSLHGTSDDDVNDGSPLYATLVHNRSQFPVALSADAAAALQVGFSDVVEPLAASAAGAPGPTRASVTVPTGKSVWLVLSATSTMPEMAEDSARLVDRVTLHTTTLGTTTSQDFPLPDHVVLYGGSTPPAEYRCS